MAQNKRTNLTLDPELDALMSLDEVFFRTYFFKSVLSTH